MSLFPAYSQQESSSKPNYTAPKIPDNVPKDWIENSSFLPIPVEESLPSPATNTVDITESISESDEGAVEERAVVPKVKKTRIPLPSRDFSTNEEFYVDKKSAKGYLTVKTLHKPACPRYRIRFSYLGSVRYRDPKGTKRYFNKSKYDSEFPEVNTNLSTMSEEEYLEANRKFNRALLNQAKDVDIWIEYINHQEKIPTKMTKTQLAEKKLEIIERALTYNFGNEKLYKLYTEIADATYPSFEVSKLLDILLAKDPTNNILWRAQILATQGSMARCVIPTVLKLYEECMQKMYRKAQQDEIMLKLFSNCALFLRQSGLNERFFALIRLALELNVTADKFSKIQPDEKDQQTLIEYEEVILKSGLPMNEIWLRIEKLRQSFNFLPCPPNVSCSDPQRIVFNEDVCYFIYPLAQRENCFSLIIIILRLLKIPLSCSSCFNNQFIFKSENLNEFDSVEDILAVFLHQTTSLNDSSIGFDSILFDLIKLTVSEPSYLSTNIGYEIYLKTIIDTLHICADCYTHDDRKRTIFVLIWLRLQRIFIILKKHESKLTKEYTKSIKSKIKNFLNKEENRSVLNFYIEYALIETEFENLQQAENIFITSILNGASQVPNADLCNAYVTFAEVLLKNEDPIKALKVLTCYALGTSLDELNADSLNEATKLRALRKLTEKFTNLISIEKNVQIMDLEQYFLPDYAINLLKAKIYYQVLLNAKFEALAYLENTLRILNEKNPRHLFLRENIFEFYLKIMQSSDKNCTVSNLLLCETTSRALEEFPENLYILRTCASIQGQLWHKIRQLLVRSNSPISIIFLIAAAQYRLKIQTSTKAFDEYAQDVNILEITFKTRVADILRCATGKNSPLRKNSLMWRLYLRSLSDVQASFEKSKNVLYTALDECPWNKALYLDGSVFVPQELSQLQDLMIEKQLRVYALPEELEILRNDTFETVK